MSEKVLFVDDDSNILAAFRRQLSKQFDIETALGGESALRQISSGASFAVVISDLTMPGMDGIELLSRIRKIAPETIRIMLTGRATLDNAIHAINSGGISRFFVKPCDSRELAIAIQQGIQQNQLMKAAHQLLQRNRRQSALLGELERQYPNITKIDRDIDGAIRIEEFCGDPGKLLKEIEASLSIDPPDL